MTTTFDVLLGQTRGSAEILQQTTPDEERKQFEAEHPPELVSTRDAVPAISDRAVDLIVTFEVTSADLYNARYRHPTWPGGQSGPTIGIGYDCGYCTADQLAQDWTAAIGQDAVNKLKTVCGKTGPGAQQALPGVASVDVPFDAANQVFRATSVRRTTSQTVHALPKAAQMPGDCLGALVSLVYNRGASFTLQGDRYNEMRQIAADVDSGNLKDISAQIRSMKRLWENDPKMAGLVRRRELEALLFEQGLSAAGA